MPVDDEIRDLGDDTWPRLVWHYCPASAFLGILESKFIRLADARWMNDPAELQWGRRTIVRALLNDFSRDHIENSIVPLASSGSRWPHIACFSARKDSLSQWRAYADNGAGYAIGLNPRRFGTVRNFPQRLFVPSRPGKTQQIASDWGIFWFPMVYDVVDQRKEARNARDRCIGGDTGPEGEWEPEAKLQVDAFAMTMAFKAPHYHEEQEYRIAYGHLSPTLAFRGADSLGNSSTYARGHLTLAFTPLVLTPAADGLSRLIAVRLGPRCSASVEATRELVKHHGFTDVQVQRSKAPYR